jgi:ankyrin repeat protein
MPSCGRSPLALRRPSNGACNAACIADDGITPLYLAALRAAADIVALLLERGADPRRVTARGDTVVEAAAYGGNTRVMQLLLAAQAPLSARALSSALSRRHFAVARLLIDAGVEVDAVDGHTARPLVFAVHYGADVELVEALLQRSGTAPAQAMWAAADRDRADLLPLLVRHGGAIDVVDNDGRGLLARAIRAGADAAATWLRGAGAQEPASEPPTLVLRPGTVTEGTFRNFAGRGRVADDGTVLVRVEVFGRATDMTLDAAWFRFDT